MSQLVDIYIGRQPIFDQKMRVFGYELLFRSGKENNHAVMEGEDNATAQVIMNLIGDLGLKEVVGDKKAFINFTEGFLLRKNQPFFPKNQIVIEVLGNISMTPKMANALEKLHLEGYSLALDDYLVNTELQSLGNYARFIKVDILSIGPKKLLKHVQALKEQGMYLLAEKVETREQFEFCRRIGFDFFQGYFFARPVIISGQTLPNNQLTNLELLASVYDPEIDLTVLSNIISRDVSLSQKLLKFVSTVAGSYSITSIHDAVLKFGIARLQSWVSMLVLTSVDDKPMELFITSLVRAKFCELVGQRLGEFKRDTYFTVGLFSTLDAVMDAPLEQLLGELHFDQKIKDALTNHHGVLGETLSAVKAMERHQTEFTLPGHLSATELSKYYLEAMQFAESIEL